MIPLSQLNLRDSDWQTELKQGFKQANDLLEYLGLPKALSCDISAQQFAVRVPQCFADRMEKGNRLDPLLLQVLPLADEQITQAEFVNDPVGDLHAIAHKGLIHKYQGRALLMLTGSCAINCRYCFRRNFPYGDHAMSKPEREQLIHYLHTHDDIHEVILSGGDPLMLSDALLQQWLNALTAIPHIGRIRVHSRLPVVLPSRITAELCNMFEQTGKQLCFVIHSNHPNEIDNSVAAAMAKLKQAGFTLLNQSVLLKGINDSAETLIALSEQLFSADVLPYYLHQLDKAKGTTHFLVDDATAVGLHRLTQHSLPGYLVPRLVKEEAGEPNKTWINIR